MVINYNILAPATGQLNQMMQFFMTLKMKEKLAIKEAEANLDNLLKEYEMKGDIAEEKSKASALSAVAVKNQEGLNTQA